MPSMEDMRNALKRITRNKSFSDEDLLTLMNNAVRSVAGGLMFKHPDGTQALSPPLPDLVASGTLTTSTTLPYISLPADYQRNLYMLHSTTQAIRIHNLYPTYAEFLTNYPAAGVSNLTCAVIAAAVRGSYLWYQGVPTTAETLVAHYYRLHMTNPPAARLGQRKLLVAPGVYDALSALLAEQAGFEALYLSGASIAYTRLGRPDIGLVTASEVADTLTNIRERVSLPVIVDADTGFGNALNTVRTVRMLERAGADAIQLEDQLAPKRCGHLEGKALIGAKVMAGKLRAALDTRQRALIVARTDAVAVEGLDAALDRAAMYAEAGADVLFVEAVRSQEDMQKTVARLGGKVPLLVNMREPGTLGAALTLPQLSSELIADNVHVHPAAQKILVDSTTPAGVILITDSIWPAGLPPGDYMLDDRSVNNRTGAVRLSDGTLAGSILTMERACRMSALRPVVR